MAKESNPPSSSVASGAATNPLCLSAGSSWEINLRGSVEDVATQVRGLLRVPEADKKAMADSLSAVWPADASGAATKLIAVKFFCRINTIEQRGKDEKREIHWNGCATEL